MVYSCIIFINKYVIQFTPVVVKLQQLLIFSDEGKELNKCQVSSQYLYIFLRIRRKLAGVWCCRYFVFSKSQYFLQTRCLATLLGCYRIVLRGKRKENSVCKYCGVKLVPLVTLQCLQSMYPDADGIIEIVWLAEKRLSRWFVFSLVGCGSSCVSRFYMCFFTFFISTFIFLLFEVLVRSTVLR